MRFFRILRLQIILILCSNFAAAEFVACPRVTSRSPYVGRFCGSNMSSSGGEFIPCVVKDWATTLHVAIQSSLREECEVERQVRSIENEYALQVREAHFARAEPPPEPQFSAEVQNVMHRLDPQNYAPSEPTPEPPGSGPYRQDSCLGDTVQSLLENEVRNSCGTPAQGIRELCTSSRNTIIGARDTINASIETTRLAQEASIAARNSDDVTFEQACSERGISEEACNTGPVTFIRSQLSVLREQLAITRAANDSCVNAITSLQDEGCFEIYERVFNVPDRRDFIAKYCTNEGLNRNIDEYIEYMQKDDPDTPVKVLRELSQFHIRNREVEAEMAAEFDKLAKTLEQLEAIRAGRQPATERGD